jgi:hypothetical protein
VPEICLTVSHPAVEREHRIYDDRGKVVSRLVLHELYEALTIIVTYANSESAGNIPPIDSSDFPIPVIDAEFQALALRLQS